MTLTREQLTAVLQRQSEYNQKLTQFHEEWESKILGDDSYKSQVEQIWPHFENQHTVLIENQSRLKDTDYFSADTFNAHFTAKNKILNEIKKRKNAGNAVNPINSIWENNKNRFFRATAKFHLKIENDERAKVENSVKKEMLDLEFKRLQNLFEGLTTLQSSLEEQVIVEDEWEKVSLYYQNEATRIIQAKPSECRLKLKEVNIPPFHGDLSSWSAFIDTFSNLIDKDVALGKKEKLIRLKDLVKGEASKLIQHLLISEENYDTALQILKERYENRRQLFSQLFDRLLDQPTMNSDLEKSVQQLLDTTRECVHAIKGMDIKIEEADIFLARIILRKFDRKGLQLYEQTIRKLKEIQTLDDVFEFLEQHLQAIKTLQVPGYEKRAQKKEYNSDVCPLCNAGGHTVSNCFKFAALSIQDRLDTVRKLKICFRCLGHRFYEKCSAPIKTCNKCTLRHHSLLHQNEEPKSSLMIKNSSVTTLLATAQIEVMTNSGEWKIMRALIDQGSQITAISEEAAQILQLPRQKKVNKIFGIGDSLVGVSKSTLCVKIRPRFPSNARFDIEALVMPKVVNPQPQNSFDYNKDVWKNEMLADPLFNQRSRIDILIGSDLMPKIVKQGLKQEGTMLGQSTELGWILSGPVKIEGYQKIKTAATVNLEKFWEMEEIPAEKEPSQDDICMKLFEETTTRDDDGKFIVRLPFSEDKSLGNSRKRAMARLISLEKRFKADPKLKEQYVKFMEEYLEMGHMKESETTGTGKYYMPHQPVIREDSLTTKLRAVFDASAKTSNSKSLNDIQLTGPHIQNNILEIMMKWRNWRYVITADIEKMYRQIKVAEEDQDYLRILWRKDHKDPMKEYQMTTVTYGTASAPFLATRSLQEIAERCVNESIKNRIKMDFYMDDFMSGADSISECIRIQKEIAKELESYGFHLRKWAANNKEIMTAIPNSGEMNTFEINNEETIKTLGLKWNPHRDEFTFKININDSEKVTKRKALSILARIFDPLGWLSPITIVAKLFIQKLWLSQYSWDEILNDQIIKEWLEFIKNLPAVQEITIPRWNCATLNEPLEIHGFADASEKAFAAVLYGKSNSGVVIIASKTKVNPIKNRKTLPKLELCAAWLLSELLLKASTVMDMSKNVYAWSDSTITLAWIRNQKSKDRFVRSKVEQIHKQMPNIIWGHISSKDNPADIASRGIAPHKLKDYELWWRGPKWLEKSKENWPKEEAETSYSNCLTQIGTHFLDTLVQKYSQFDKLVRVTSYVVIFIRRCQRKRKSCELTIQDLEEAKTIILKHHQETEFPDEIKKLQHTKEIDVSSKVASLHPFLDEKGIMRVGGRLNFSDLKYNQKHPIILNKSQLADLVIAKNHKETLHGGNRLMETMIRRSYWIAGLKNSIKKIIRYCVKCTRYKNQTQQQIMGQIPEARVKISNPFTHTGVDYAGPIHIRVSKGRGNKSYKGYIAVFVCMSTKAVHLEAVSDLTTEAFLAAFRRFSARRGKCAHLYSDNGTNFVGAERILHADFAKAMEMNSIAPVWTSELIKWHFIPPAAPHFGGIWEAGVKSVKYHLKRVIGASTLTYEEISTLLAQIEAILNSRPLYQNDSSKDFDDILTPGHFLIGKPLLDIPEPFEDRAISSIDRWKMLSRMKTQFWQKWKDEYLVTLQQRFKWKKIQPNLQEGQIVLVKNENTGASRWPLGRIQETYPGLDGKTRVVEIKTQNGVIRRPIHKIVLLETEKDEESYKKTSKKVNAIMVMSFLLMLMTNSCSASVAGLLNNSSMVKPLENNTMIYLDPMGKIDIISSKWNMIIYYDLSSFMRELHTIPDFLYLLRWTCQSLEKYDESCKTMLRAIENQYEHLQSKYELLIGPRRAKRAPFEFVGSLHHTLFGTMDADDRKEIEEKMENLHDNQLALDGLYKKQTSLIDSTVNILKKTTDEVNAALKDIESHINKLDRSLAQVKDANRAALTYQMIVDQVNLLIADCEKTLTAITDIVLDLNHGKINPQLLRPKQLKQELENIKGNLPPKVKLPGKKGSELREVYNLMEGHAILIDHRLIIKTEVPLFNQETSIIYKLISIPFIKNGKTIKARIKSKHMVYNYNLDAYVLVTDSELNKCARQSNDHLMCKGHWAWSSAADNSCEISALKQSDNPNCEFQQTTSETIWTELSLPNTWLYKIYNVSKLEVNCGTHQSQIIKLAPQGVLKLEEGCTARHENHLMTAGYAVSSKDEIQNPSFPITKIADGVKMDEVKPLTTVMINNTRDINFLKNLIEEQKKENIKLKGLNVHNVSGHSALILVLAIIIIAIVMYLRTICKQEKAIRINFSPQSNGMQTTN